MTLNPQRLSALSAAFLYCAICCSIAPAQPPPGPEPPPSEVREGMPPPPRKPAPRGKPDGARRPKPEPQLGAPDKIRNLEEWRKADQAFQDGAAKLIDIAARKRKLREGTTGRGGRVDNQDYTPGSIIARRNWREYQGQMDELLRKERDLRDEVVQLARTVYVARRDLTPMLRARRDQIEALPPAEKTPEITNEAVRLDAWLLRLEKPVANAPLSLLAAIIGEEVARDLDPPRGGPGGHGRPGRPQSPPDDGNGSPDPGRGDDDRRDGRRGDPGRGREEAFRHLEEENDELRQRVEELEMRLSVVEKKTGIATPTE